MSEKVSVLFSCTAEFFHPGTNWSGVNCPKCGADAESWWGEAMDIASKSNFENLFVTAKCCEEIVSLNELQYNWPAAFGRFALEAMNPNILDLSPDQELSLNTAVGHKLRKIWVHL